MDAITPAQLVAHWCNVEGRTPADVLNTVLDDHAVEECGDVVRYAGTALACPHRHAGLLSNRVALAVAVAAHAPSPAAMCSLILARRHHTAAAAGAFGALREVVAPTVGGALRCLRPDLQKFVASVAHVIARACPDARSWVAGATKVRWDVAPYTVSHAAIVTVVRAAEIKGKIARKSSASLSLGGKLGVYWLPDDALLILLLLLFGPPAFFGAPPPCLPPPLAAACLPPWKTAISFSGITPSPRH